MEVNQAEIQGESGTGYEGPEKGPFACHNCEYFRDNSCGNKLMMERSKRPRTDGGRVVVSPDGCCEYIERVGKRRTGYGLLKRKK